jgi:hypothetical protein
VTRGKKTESEAMQKAIADLEELKRRRAEGAEAGTPRKLGRPARVAATPAEAAPAKRGRKPRAAQASSEQPTFGVGQLTAHRPLGLLEVQEKTDLDALLADPRLAPHIAMRLAERFALVLPAQLEKLQAALLKVGHTPKLQSAGPTGAAAAEKARGKA